MRGPRAGRSALERIGFASGTLRTGRPRRLGGRRSSPGGPPRRRPGACPRPRRSTRHRCNPVCHGLPVEDRHPRLPALVVHDSESIGRGGARPVATLGASMASDPPARSPRSPVAIGLLVVGQPRARSSGCSSSLSLTTIVALYWFETASSVPTPLARMATAEGLDGDGHHPSINGRALSAAELRNPAAARVVLMPFFVIHYGCSGRHGRSSWFALPMICQEMGGATGGPSPPPACRRCPSSCSAIGASFVYNSWLGGERLHVVPGHADERAVRPGHHPPRDDRRSARSWSRSSARRSGARAAASASRPSPTSRPTSPSGGGPASGPGPTASPSSDAEPTYWS